MKLLPNELLLAYSGAHQTPVDSSKAMVTQIILIKFSRPINKTKQQLQNPRE